MLSSAGVPRSLPGHLLLLFRESGREESRYQIILYLKQQIHHGQRIKIQVPGDFSIFSDGLILPSKGLQRPDYFVETVLLHACRSVWVDPFS